MFFWVFLYATAIVSAQKFPTYSLREGPEHFENFIVDHSKVYNSEDEKAMRYEIFLKNLEEIIQLNAQYNYTEFGITQFSDLTLQEFVTKHSCFKASSDYFGSCRSQEIINRNEGLGRPTQIDWRERNVISSVKQQGLCGACWAFSAVGNVESVNAIKTGQLVELSEQQLLDCDRHDTACRGGTPEAAIEITPQTSRKEPLDPAIVKPRRVGIHAGDLRPAVDVYRYFISNGAMSSASYPYIGSASTCEYQPGEVAVRVTDCVQVGGSEDSIAEYLAANGPVSIAIAGAPVRKYIGGVLNGQMCQDRRLTHAVLLVGYGVDSASGLEYWLVKNSWGPTWGEEGYFRMQKGVNCLSLLTVPSVSAVV